MEDLLSRPGVTAEPLMHIDGYQLFAILLQKHLLVCLLQVQFGELLTPRQESQNILKLRQWILVDLHKLESGHLS